LDLNRLARPRLRVVFRHIRIGIGRVALGDRSNGPGARGLVKVLGQQAAHDGVAGAAAAAAHHDADEVTIAAPQIGDEVEAGGARVAGLDAVDTFDAAEQVVVAMDGMAVEIERLGGEVAIIAREAVLDGPGQRRLVARGGHLLVGGQTGGIDVDGPGHAQRPRLAGHHLGEIAFIAAAEGFRDHNRSVVGRFRHDTLDGVFDTQC
jgi:hypothetical protein